MWLGRSTMAVKPGMLRQPSSPFFPSLAVDDLRIDQRKELPFFSSSRDVNYNHAQVHSNLGSRQPDTLFRVHGLFQVVDQFLEIDAELLDLGTDLLEFRCPVFENRSDHNGFHVSTFHVFRPESVGQSVSDS